MRETLHILSVGMPAPSNRILMLDVLLQHQQYCVTLVNSLKELYREQHEDSFEIAVLHQTLSCEELHDACIYIRRKWPKAKTLVITKEINTLANSLYDEWVHPEYSRSILRRTIEHLSESTKENAELEVEKTSFETKAQRQDRSPWLKSALHFLSWI